MQFKRILGLAAILSLSFVLAACSGNATPAATEATQPDSTEAVETDGGDADADNDSGEEASADLPETASAGVATGGTFTVKYPSGWTATPVEGAGSVTFVGSEPTQIVSVSFLPEATGADAAAVLDMQASALAATGTASEVTTTDNGSYMTITVAGMDTIYYVAAVDGGYAYVFGSGVDVATLEAIAANASYSN